MKPKSKRSLKYVIKSLPNDFESQEIMKVLQNAGIATRHIVQLKSLKQDWRLLPIFLIPITNYKESKKKLVNLTYLNHMKIKIEIHRTKNFKQ